MPIGMTLPLSLGHKKGAQTIHVICTPCSFKGRQFFIDLVKVLFG